MLVDIMDEIDELEVDELNIKLDEVDDEVVVDGILEIEVMVEMDEEVDYV